MRYYINSILLIKQGRERSKKLSEHNKCEGVKELFKMQWSQEDYYLALESEAGLLLIKELYLSNKSGQFIIMNLYTRKTDVDLARRAASCMSLNKRSRTEIYHLYEVSTKIIVFLFDVINQTTQLKSDVRVSMITRSDCERVIKSKSYKEVTHELI